MQLTFPNLESPPTTLTPEHSVTTLVLELKTP